MLLEVNNTNHSVSLINQSIKQTNEFLVLICIRGVVFPPTVSELQVQYRSMYGVRTLPGIMFNRIQVLTSLEVRATVFFTSKKALVNLNKNEGLLRIAKGRLIPGQNNAHFDLVRIRTNIITMHQFRSDH
jgi:hypothetical protein